MKIRPKAKPPVIEIKKW